MNFFNESERPAPLDRSDVADHLAAITTRPRFAFFVLDLIERASRSTGSVGPYVRDSDGLVPVRDWLCDKIIMISGREPKRLAIAAQVRRDLATQNLLPANPEAARQLVNDVVRDRIRKSGRSNISRAVSDLVKAGLVRRHYQGFAVDHLNRGAQREAVYQVTDLARQAFASDHPL